MEYINKEEFLSKGIKALEEIYDMLEQLPQLKLNELQPVRTAFVIIDMINGFTREGALKSSRVEGLIPAIVELSRKCDKHGIVKIAFADNHTDASPEFGAYPVHCMENTYESEVVEEIKEVGGYILIPKNSTNGVLEERFQDWLGENENIDTFIITGGCTDICIQQFAITLKTWFNMHNKKSRIIVPVNGVETYDLGLHSGDLVHVMALFNMVTNGIELVASLY